MHEGLEESPPMRLRIHIDSIVVQPSHHRVLACGQFVQFRIKKHEVSLSHRAFHFSDGVAHQASQTGIGFGGVNDLLDWRVH